VEPAEFVPGWHIDCLAEHLQAVARGDIRRLLITIPPRHGKSLITSVFFPSWVWIDRPESRWLCASYAESLAVRDNVRARRIITSAWYQNAWSRFELSGDQATKQRYENNRGGHRIAVGIGGSATGEGGDFLLVDDAHNVSEVQSDAVRKATLDWYDTVFATRANDPARSARVVIGQKVHEDDLAAHLLQQGGWTHLNLPAQFEGDRRKTVIGWSDPRTTEGELLWPMRFGETEITEARRTLGAFAFSAQYQQRPAPAEGGIVRKAWWRFYRELPKLDSMILSLDCTFKGTSDADYVVIQCWGAAGANRYLIDQVRRQMNFPETKAAFITMCHKWPEARARVIEAKANGQAIVDSLQAAISGIIPFSPTDSKEARLASVSPQIESGNVFLPDPQLNPWVSELIEEFSIFPRGRHDDQIDAAVQALLRFEHNSMRLGWNEFFRRVLETGAQNLDEYFAIKERQRIREETKEPPRGLADGRCGKCGGTNIRLAFGGVKRCACGNQMGR
jgi:predicted phage terminase large subunit-like protein